MTYLSIMAHMSMVTFAKLPGFLCATSFKFTSWSSIWMSCMHPWNDGWRTEWLALFMWFKNPVKQKEQEDYNEYPASFIKGLPSIWVDTATWLMLAFLWFLLTRIRCATSWEYEIYFRQESGSEGGLNKNRPYRLTYLNAHFHRWWNYLGRIRRVP